MASNISGTSSRMSQEPEDRAAKKLKEGLNYKTLNEMLARKNIQLKGQIHTQEKEIERLRGENQSLREKNQTLITATENEKIEIIVSQRVQNKLAHLAAISQRTIQYLQTAGMDMTEALKDIKDTKPIVTIKKPRAKLACDPGLDKVDESPTRYPTIVLDESSSTESISDTIELSSGDENATPKAPVNVNRAKGRRSSLLHFDQISDEQDPVPEIAAVKPPRRGPVIIKPATPSKVIGSTPKPPTSGRKKKSDADGFAIPNTPASSSSPSTGGSTVRRQRSAKLKIQSLKEPSTGTKLRRPGKFDEPVPYIDRFNY